ncbi:MAG: cytochrome c oxidase subunit I [Thermomicrobia bacterium]|nr:cytochrome c oxidase subunit I [Thermomicrobia bacterium]
MATITTPNVSIAPPPTYAPGKSAGAVIWDWMTTVDHKKIGVMYAVLGVIYFVVGGLEALLIRLQLAKPNGKVLTPSQYDQVFTMHATTMIFLFIIPVFAGFANYFIPLMIGARDMAFPRLNAFGFWMLLFGGLFLNSSFFFGGAPDSGWFAYAPLTEPAFNPGRSMDFWAAGLTLLGISSIAGSINVIVTTLKMRCPGMRFNTLPLFVWTTLVQNFLLLFALPSLTTAAIFLLFDRHLGTSFFKAESGGDPLLWQHLFWAFGHPEVYILILPAFGIVSETLPVFSRKPVFGYIFIAWSSVAIGFLSFIVWVHHMFATGLPDVALAFFASSTTLIAIPTAVKVFNWTATLWGGSIVTTTSLLFSVGFLTMFPIGGLSGVSLAVVPFDWQITDTYYVVAHIHYVFFGGTALAILAAIYYWFPKVTGRMLSERLGRWNFWFVFIGLNLTFFPMHMLGLLGMPRRQWTYHEGLGWSLYNFIASIGAFTIAVGILIFLINLVVSFKSGARAGADPWDAWTLEWATPSPPPEYNFIRTPIVRSRRPLWDQKHPDDQDWMRGGH